MLRNLASFNIKTMKMNKPKKLNSLTNKPTTSNQDDTSNQCNIQSDVKNRPKSKAIVSSVKTRRMKKLEELNSNCLSSEPTNQATTNCAQEKKNTLRIEKGTDAKRTRSARDKAIPKPRAVNSSKAAKKKVTASSQTARSRRSKSAHISKEKTLLGANELARSKSVESMTVSTSKKLEHTTFNESKEKQEKDASVDLEADPLMFSLKKIADKLYAFSQAKIASKETTTNERKKKILSEFKMKVTETTKATSNEDVKQRADIKLKDTEQQTHTGNAHSIFGSSNGQSAPVQQTVCYHLILRFTISN